MEKAWKKPGKQNRAYSKTDKYRARKRAYSKTDKYRPENRAEKLDVSRSLQLNRLINKVNWGSYNLRKVVV